MSLGLTSLELAGLLLSGEFALVAVAVPAFLLRRQRQQVSADAVATETLIASVEKKAPSRRDALSTIFATTYQLEGDELEAKVDEFVAREQAFYQVMTRVYLERDGDSLQSLPEELTKVISPWLRMTPRNMVDSASFSALESTNAALSAELDDTKRSMSDLMNEYMRAFDKERALNGVDDSQSAAAVEEEAAPAAAMAEDDDMDAAFATDDEPLPAEAGETLQMAGDDIEDAIAEVAERQTRAMAADDLAELLAAASPPDAEVEDIDDILASAQAAPAPVDEAAAEEDIDNILASAQAAPASADEAAAEEDIDDILARAKASPKPAAAATPTVAAADDIDDILAQARVAGPAASTEAAVELDYIDVSEDPEDEVAFSQDDIDALTDLFETEMEEDQPVAATA